MFTGSESEGWKLVAGRLCSVRTRPDDSCTSACFRTRSVGPKPDQAIQIGSGPVLHNMIRASFGRTEPNRIREVGIYDPARFWLHAGRNWAQPKRFRYVYWADCNHHHHHHHSWGQTHGTPACSSPLYFLNTSAR